jgi:hypothetical protein
MEARAIAKKKQLLYKEKANKYREKVQVSLIR